MRSRSCFAVVLLMSAVCPLALSAASVQVNSANPNSVAQGTIDIDIAIAGSGFKRGANSKFFVTGTTDSGGVTVNSTTFVGSSQVTANITVPLTATVSSYDIVVTNTDGSSGKGTGLLGVEGNGNAALCTLQPLPSNVTALGTLNPVAASGAPVYANQFGMSVKSRLVTLMGQPAVMVAVGEGASPATVEVFFLRPDTGALLDGVSGYFPVPQPHVTVTPVSATVIPNLVIADFNGDGIPDMAFHTGNSTANIQAVLGTGGSCSNSVCTPLGFSAPIAVVTGVGANSQLAAGNLDPTAPGDELAVGSLPINGKGNSFTPGKLLLFRYNGGFVNYLTLTDPENLSSTNFGAGVAVADVTGDGITDVVVGASSGAGGAGRVWVFPGPNFSSPFSLTGSKGMELGYRAAIGNFTEAAGGVSDIFSVTGLSSASAEGVVFAGPISSSSLVDITLAPAAGLSTTGFGTNIAAGDIDGDGRADALIADPNSGPAGCNNANPGIAYLYLSGQGFPTLTIMPPTASSGTQFGWDVSAVSGTKLFLIGAKAWNVGSVQSAGQVFVYSLK